MHPPRRSAFTNWCYWNITPTWFNLPTGTGLDYNDLTISNTFVNISTNYFGTSSSGAALIRLPKAQMSTCSGFSYNRINRNDNFTFKLVPGSTSTLYFGSNWGRTNGSSFRLFSWPETHQLHLRRPHRGLLRLLHPQQRTELLQR